MEHGISWLSFLPGVRQLEAYLQHASESVTGRQGFLFNRPLVTQHVIAALLVALIVLAIAFKARADLKRAGDNAVIPDPEPSLRNFLEATFEWLYGQARAIIGDEAPRYFPVIATLALFIFFSNILGLVPGFLPPTDNWNTTGACAIFVFLYYNYQGLRVNGLRHIGHMANPSGEWWGWFLAPLMFPIEIVSHVARPFSLAVRLATNMVGDHAVLSGFLGLVPVLVPLPFILLGLIVCLVQTLVFVLLSMIYIALAVEQSHAEHGQASGGEAHAHA